MTKININPQFGTIEESKNVNLQIRDFKNSSGVRIKIENITNSSICYPIFCFTDNVTIDGEYIYIEKDINHIDLNLDLNIPEHSSHSVSSIFVNIEKKNDNSYKLDEISPSSYYIQENQNINFDIINKYNNLSIDPLFVDENGFCSISVNSVEKELNLSINDKKINILMDKDGKGSLNFKGQEVLDDNNPIIKKFPINIIKDDKEYFSGKYIYILPSSIATATDPRCDIPGYVFEVPDECLDDGEPGTGGPGGPEVNVPTIDIPFKPNGPDTNNNKIEDICRIQNFSSTLLTDGLIISSIIGADSSITDVNDKRYNKNRVFIFQDESSLDCRVISSERVIIPPKTLTDEFVIFVEQDIWERASDYASDDLLIAFLNEDLFHKAYKVSGREIDEYIGYKLILSNKDGSTPSIEVSDWSTCDLSIFYQKIISSGNDVAPSLDISEVRKLPFITDTNENTISVINSSVASNFKNIGEDSDEFYIYIIAEAQIDSKKQLFFYSFSLNETQTNFNTFGWKQLTFEGNNSHPKIEIGKDNNLHIFWESDRSGINQVYYGILGQSFVSMGNSIISSALDKKSELNKKENKPFEYTSQNILVPYNEYLSVDPVTNLFVQNKNNEGYVSIVDNKNINISGNTINDTFMAFMPLFNTLNPSIDPILDGDFSQINYQIDFDFYGTVGNNSSSLEKDDINMLYNQWEDQFNVEIEETFNNTPVYTKDNNKFVIGKQISIYDRFIPILGSYKNENVEDLSDGSIINNDFELNFNGKDGNIRHYVIGVMPEKIRFKATNIQSFLDFCEDKGYSTSECINYYIPEEEKIIYTGKYKIVVLLNSNEKYYGNQNKNNFKIIRELPGEYNFDQISNIKTLVNYSKMNCEEKRYIFGENLDIIPSLNEFLFFCSLTILIDDIAEYSESFITDLSDKYRKFDLGFGVPSNGRFISNDFLPYETSIYDNVDIDFNFNNVIISNPTFSFNEELIDVPIYTRDMSRLIVQDVTPNEGEEDECKSFYNENDLLTLSLSSKQISLNPSQVLDTTDNDDNGDFLQVPLTFEGINKSINLDIGQCNDVHVVWESNRDKYWNIYYANSINRNIPFRIEVPITNTKSNSLSPDVSINKNGKRMIVWHDNRDGAYKVYSARSLEGYNCECEDNNGLIIANNLSKDLCNISFPYTASLDETYNFTLEFYTDNKLENLYETISSSNSVDGWKIDGVPMEEGGVQLDFNSSVIVTYDPQKDDKVFDKILYIKVNAIPTS